MFPKKASDEIKDYAKGIDIPQDDVADMINGFYRELKKTCSELKYPIVNIRGLGYMKIGHRKVMKGIEKLTRELVDIPEEKRDSYYDIKHSNMNKLKRMKGQIEAEWEKEKKKKEIKKQYKQNRDGLERDTQTGLE